MNTGETIPKSDNDAAAGGNDDLEVDNSHSVLERMARLYAEQLMSDITLQVSGVSYPAHRLILCSGSPVFQVMLMNREWSEWRESCVVLQETAACADVFPQFLRYFYTGQIRISHETVLPVLSLADKYNVKDLASLCVCYMSNHVASAAQRGQLVAWMQYTHMCGHDHVAQALQKLFAWNVEWVWETGDLSAMEPELLVRLLQQNDLVVRDEYTLFNFVADWLMRQRSALLSAEAGLSEEEALAHWNSLVPLVLAHIRFPMMDPKQLAKLVLNPLSAHHKDLFMERMAVAMSYHYGHVERTKEVHASEGGLTFTPRLYTEDAWGSLLTVDNLVSLPCYHTRTFIFSTRPSSSPLATDQRSCEWTVDLYPKGVWFRKSLMIAWTGTYDVPEVVLRTVRVALTCQNPPAPDEPDLRVKIGLLVWGVQQGVEHVARVSQRVHRFSQQSRVLNVDDALDFDELNAPLYSPQAHHQASHSGQQEKCANCQAGDSAPSQHLLGPHRDQLRIQVVIVPLTDECDVAGDT